MIKNFNFKTFLVGMSDRIVVPEIVARVGKKLAVGPRKFTSKHVIVSYTPGEEKTLRVRVPFFCFFQKIVQLMYIYAMAVRFFYVNNYLKLFLYAPCGKTAPSVML